MRARATFALLLIALLGSATALGGELVVRQPKVAGSFYPAARSELAAVVDDFLGKAEYRRLNGRVRALIAPHAGYVYSGQVAARGYKLLRHRYKRVFIVASNHFAGAPYFKFSVSTVDYYQTPLGRVRVSPIAGELLKSDLFSYVPQAHATHVVEAQLPFLQTVLPDFEIVPIVTGSASRAELSEVARLISGYLDDDTLFVVSSDLSHYHPYDQAVELDRACVGAVAALDPERASHCEACGLGGILILLDVARARGWNTEIVDYENSGDTAGNKNRVVGYSSIVFLEDDLVERDKRRLLDLSRNVLDSYIRDGVMPNIDDDLFRGRLRQTQGCFVTLEIGHRLRGCIGHIIPQVPLYRCVIQNTLAAALHDGRFRPVNKDELKKIKIEISALSVPRPLEGRSRARLLQSLVPLRDGVILRNGAHQSTFLPQVWEQLSNKKTFLSRLCVKGGLAPNCWQDPATNVLTYEATVFDE